MKKTHKDATGFVLERSRALLQWMMQRRTCPPLPRIGRIAQLAVMASAWLLLTSCNMFSNRVVTVETASASEKNQYYREESFSREGLSFESENFLRANMEQDDFTKDPEDTLRRLNDYYEISDDPKYLRIAADFCNCIAAKEKDEEKAIRCHLSALELSRQGGGLGSGVF